MRRVLTLLLLVFLTSSVDAYQVNVGINFKTSTPPPAGSVPWSTLGIVADSATDNTVALNALPVTNPIFGDCPAGGTIKFSGQWLWQSNMQIYVKAGCVLVTTWTNPTLGFASITQADLTNPISNVLVDGMYLKRLEAPSKTLNRSVKLYVNHFQLTHSTIDTYHQAFYVRGSDQLWAYNTLTNPCPQAGCDGLRHIGNVPKVATTSGRPANVWVHDNSFQSGDASYQICQPLNESGWTNTSTDDVRVENNYGAASSSALILVGEDNLIAGESNFSCTNALFQNMSGSGGNRAILVSASFAPMVTSNITILNSTIDQTSCSSTIPSAFVENAEGATVSNILMSGITLLRPCQRGMVIQGATNTTFTAGSIAAPITGALGTVLLENDTGTVISNSTIGALAGGNISVSPTTFQSVSPTITGNTLTGISSNKSGINLQNVSGASITGNTMLRTTGATGTIGITFTNASGADAGTTNSQATGNNVSNMNHAPTIVFTCNGGTTNAATGNTGAADSTCP